MVLTTHQLEEAERRCERIVIIDHGRIVAAGTVRDLMSAALGASRTLSVELSSPLPMDAMLPAQATLDPERRAMRVSVRDVGADVAGILTELSAAGGRVTDIALSGATLQDVFIALTGRDLRE